jgi:hypothetical protein
MRLTYLDLSVSALKKCNANPHHRSTKEEKHCVAQQPPMWKFEAPLSGVPYHYITCKESVDQVLFSMSVPRGKSVPFRVPAVHMFGMSS